MQTLSHDGIWSALDRLAARQGISVSALAKKAGLDATSFNRSKRVTSDGRERWPSTESIAKVLAATHTPVEDFLALMGVGGLGDGELMGGNPGADIPYGHRPEPHPGFAEEGPSRASGPMLLPVLLPLLGLSQAGRAEAFDPQGLPLREGWDEIAFPDLDDAGAYALEVAGDDLLPLYRDGDILVISPKSPYGRGDRVVVKTRAGVVLARELVRKTARAVELRAPGGGADQTLPAADVLWIARIVWASQ